MKKLIHEKLIDLYKDFLPRYQKEFIDRNRQTDHVVVWLTAISTGAIALILSQSDKLHIDNPIYLKASVASLLLSIISGVTFRAFFYPLEGLQAQKLLHFEGYCYGRTLEVHGPIEIKDFHTIEDIARSLKNDMGLDYDHWLKRDYLNRDFWVEHYNSWADFWKKSEETGAMELSQAIAFLNNKNPKEAENILTANSDDKTIRKKITIYTFICSWSYQLSLIFFVLAVVSVAIGYIFAFSV